MPTELEGAMESLIVVFHRYATEDGGYYRIHRDKLKQLLKNELPAYRQVRDSAVFDKLLKDLDPSGAGQLNFEQFFSLFAGLSFCCEKAHEATLKKGKK